MQFLIGSETGIQRPLPLPHASAGGDGRDAAGEGEELAHDYPTKNELYNELLFVSAGRKASLVT